MLFHEEKVGFVVKRPTARIQDIAALPTSWAAIERDPSIREENALSVKRYTNSPENTVNIPTSPGSTANP